MLDQVAQSDRGAALRRRLQTKYSVAADDVLDAYWAAYLAVCHASSCRATTEPEMASYLARAVENRLVDELRRRKHERPATDELIASVASVFEQPVEAELVEAENDVDLEPVVSEIASQLNDRQRHVLSLFCRDTPRKEIAKQLAITEKRAKKDIEAILKRGRHTLLRLAGGGCPEGEDLTTRLAFGLETGPEAMGRAHAHLAACASCARLFERLDLFRDKAAGILPVPVPAAAHADPGLPRRAVHRAADLATSIKHQVAHATAGARRHALDTGQQLKAQAASRVIDPTPLSGVRPGAAFAVVGSCLAVGGGAGACLHERVNPVRTIANAIAANDSTKSDASGSPTATTPAPTQDTSPPPPIVPAQAPAPQPVQTTPSVQPAATPTPAAPTPQPTPSSESQFDPGAGAAQATSKTSVTTSKPAPGSSGGDTEFSGP